MLLTLEIQQVIELIDWGSWHFREIEGGAWLRDRGVVIDARLGIDGLPGGTLVHLSRAGALYCASLELLDNEGEIAERFTGLSLAVGDAWTTALKGVLLESRARWASVHPEHL